MAASGSRERRTAIWPWLVMPLVVLVAFYALNRIHKHPGPPWSLPHRRRPRRRDSPTISPSGGAAGLRG
jgi:hypothetical protein